MSQQDAESWANSLPIPSPQKIPESSGQRPSLGTNSENVSLQDLLSRDRLTSAPNATSFANLTSLSSHNESQEYADNFHTSPLVGNSGDLDEALGDPWHPLFPLFPQDDQVNQSPLPPEEELEVSEQRRQLDPRRRNNRNSQSASAVSGVSSRERLKPLPPIVVDPNDAIAIKRVRSTLAARRSRQRKLDQVKELEGRVAIGKR